MPIKDLAKEAAGWVLWELGSRSLQVRRFIRPLGMRTRQRWYTGRTGHIQLYGGRTVRLGALDENYLSFELFWRGWSYYEPPTIALVHALCQDARTFLDVGANVGYFTLSVAAWYPSLRVVSFEPNPKLNRILRDNVARNGFGVLVEPHPVFAVLGNAVGAEQAAGLDPFRDGADGQASQYRRSTADDYGIGASTWDIGHWLNRSSTVNKSNASLFYGKKGAP